METKSALVAAAAVIVIAAILFIAMQQPAPESGQGCAAGYSWCETLQKCIAPPQECGAPLPEGAELNLMGEGVCEEQGGHVVAGDCPGGEFKLADVKGTGAQKSCCIEMAVPAPSQDEGGGVAAPLPLPQGTGEESGARP